MFKQIFFSALSFVLFLCAVGLMVAIVVVGEHFGWPVAITVVMAVASCLVSAIGIVIFEEKFLNG